MVKALVFATIRSKSRLARRLLGTIANRRVSPVASAQHDRTR